MGAAVTSGAVQLLVSDVDGTLLDTDRRLAPATVRAARELADAGIRLALASSRPPRGMVQFVLPLGLSSPMAGFNGAQIVTTDLDGLVERPLDAAVVAPLVGSLRSADVDVWAFQGSRWLVEHPDGARVEHHAADVGYRPDVVDDLLVTLLGDGAPATKVVGVSEDHDAVAAARTLVVERLGGRVAASCSQPVYLDVTDPGATKGAALLALCDLLDVSPGATAAIGDGANDVTMFAAAGLGIAMGNAPSSVRDAADVVTGTNGDDGWAAAVAEHVLSAGVAGPAR